MWPPWLPKDIFAVIIRIWCWGKVNAVISVFLGFPLESGFGASCMVTCLNRIASACWAGAARLSIGETHFAVLTCFDYLGFSFQALYVDVSLPALKSHVSTILDIVFRHYMLTCKLSGVRTLAEIMTFLQFAKMYNIVSQMKNQRGQIITCCISIWNGVSPNHSAMWLISYHLLVLDGFCWFSLDHCSALVGSR